MSAAGREQPCALRPQWPLPDRVRALTTLRSGGMSSGPWSSFNLGDQVGDDPEAVAANRRLLVDHFALPASPNWLRQVHGREVVVLPGGGSSPEADAAVTREPGVVCAVLTADCLPVFLGDRQGQAVGIAHAGWRGLAAGVIEAAVEAMDVAPGQLHAWLGPAISQAAFEVGGEVREAMLAEDPGADAAFQASGQRWRADLYRLAARRLESLGVAGVHGGGRCTFSEREAFFSHRREAPCGRMASLIWLENEGD